MTVKDKLYNYEVTPPAGVWEDIVLNLDDSAAEIIPLYKKRNRIFYYSLAAASIAIIIFAVIFFIKPVADNKEIAKTQFDTVTNEKVIITVPVKENKTDEKDKVKVPQTLVKTYPDKKPAKDKIQTHVVTENTDEKKDYITMAGPDGQSIKVSTKAATLINSIEEKPVWNKKVTQWKEMMKANTLAPTPGNFLDIIELTKSLRDK